MNDKSESQLLKYIRSNERAQYANAIISIVASFICVYCVFGFGISQFVMGTIFTYMMSKVMNFFTSMYFKILLIGGYYGDGTPEPTENPRGLQEATFNVVKTPESALGKFMDVEFFDWIDLKDQDGKIQRWKFIGTTNTNNPQARLGSNTMIMQPGLLYQVEQ